MSRWHVCLGGYPNGWESPLLETDDLTEAIVAFSKAERGPLPSMTTVAIFDNERGEGEPLDPELAADRLAEEEYMRDVRNYNENRDRFAR